MRGRDTSGTAIVSAPDDDTPTLGQLGIHEKQSVRFQCQWLLPEATVTNFERF